MLCDAVYPIVTSEMTEDHSGYTAAESELFSAITGIETSEYELDHIGDRIFNLERAIMMREGRSKTYDLQCGVIRYLKNRPDTDGLRLDETKFTQALEELYRLRGWETTTGWPKIEKLNELELGTIAD